MIANYPPHWWAKHSEEGRPDWEILPDAAGPGEVILSKRNELGCLSNFAPTPFVFRGVHYASLEGFWQMMFYPEGPTDPRALAPSLSWPHTRAQVAQMTSHEAWAAGDLGFRNMRELGINWVTFEGKRYEYWTAEKGDHYHLIVEAMTEKLRQNPIVQRTLLATGDLSLRADHVEPPDAPPSWAYYAIWMKLREDLKRSRAAKA